MRRVAFLIMVFAFFSVGVAGGCRSRALAHSCVVKRG